MPRKIIPWDALTPAYRKRLLSNGITEEARKAGASPKAARGKHSHGEHGGYRAKAIKQGITNHIDEFGLLPRELQERLGEAYVEKSVRGKGEIVNPKRKKGQRIRRKPSERQKNLDLFLDQWMRENGVTFDYKIWRTNYMNGFSNNS